MQKVSYAEVEVDRCTSCGGIWFDLLEKEDLTKATGSEKIDSGSTSTGRKMNEMKHIDCPVCKTRMGTMVDLNQPHIQFESCDTCQGAFLDAGEYKDLKEETITEFVKDMLS
jgi:uncharacterized protein